MRTEQPQDDHDRHIQDLERENERLREQLERERREKELLREQKDKLEREKRNLEEEKKVLDGRKRELERQNKNLKEQLARLKGSLPQLAASDKTAEAAGVPSSKTFYRRNRQEGEKSRRTGGQPGHPGHARKRPIPNTPPTNITLDLCPECGRPLGDPIKGADQGRVVTDIPLPSHIVYEIIHKRYWCGHCRKLVRGEASWLPPQQEFGPAVTTWITYQRMLGLSIGKIQSSLKGTYDIGMSEATILKLERWVADTLKDDYERLKEELVKAEVVHADETGFRVGGNNGWLWVFAHVLSSVYVVAPTRGHTVPEDILAGFNGYLGRDAWGPYDVVKCSGHQLDLMHVNRWLERAEHTHGVEPRRLLSTKEAKQTRAGRPPENFLRFDDGVRSILRRAIKFSEGKPPPSPKARKEAAKGFREEMRAICNVRWKDKDAIRISKQLRKRLDMLFTFVEKAVVPWHNNEAERSVRPGVLARKNSGGRRTWKGAKVYQILLSVYETLKKRGGNFMECVNMKLGGFFYRDMPVAALASKG
jgi:transposase